MKQRKQKIIKVGNSAAVIIPSFLLKEGNLKIGDEVIIETVPKYQAFLFKKEGRKNKISLSPEFFNWLEKIEKKYKKTIQELALK